MYDQLQRDSFNLMVLRVKCGFHFENDLKKKKNLK